MPVQDTIVAISTPPGRGGIGVIRLSGAESLTFTRKLLADQNFSPVPNHVVLKTLRDIDSQDVLDQSLISYFKSPQSFTGEDVIELSCHGSPVVLLRIVDVLLALGARAAEPGEFTLRAVANGRINLSQAEAVRDLIDARTEAAVKHAARQLGGELSARLQPFKDKIIEIIVRLESSLEFVEDDLPEQVFEATSQQLDELHRKMKSLADSFQAGRLLKEGFKIALVGRPNAGKSSLFNALLENERSIVTDIPGTTRDTISESINLSGVPVLLTDTAGVHESENYIERLGIERTERAVVDADLVLMVLDGTQTDARLDISFFEGLCSQHKLLVYNKSDLPTFNSKFHEKADSNSDCLPVSAKTGDGVERLKAKISEFFSQGNDFSDGFLITNARHFELLQQAGDSIYESQTAFSARASEEMVVIGLYNALRFLGEITGETSTEEILGEIFATFCIGK